MHFSNPKCVPIKIAEFPLNHLESPKSAPRSVKPLKSVPKSVKILYSEKRPGIWCHIYVLGGIFQDIW